MKTRSVPLTLWLIAPIFVLTANLVTATDSNSNKDDALKKIDKKLDAIMESLRIVLKTGADYINQMERPYGRSTEGNGNLIVKNLLKSALFVDKNNVEKMTIAEINKSASNLSTFPKESSLKKMFKGVKYEIMSKTIGEFKTFATMIQMGAVKLCADSNRQLLSIKSKEVNDMITNWIFGDLDLQSRVWINLKERRNGTVGKLVWGDGTTVMSDGSSGYSNLYKCESPVAANEEVMTMSYYPATEREDKCIQMTPSLVNKYWYDYNCNLKGAKAGHWITSPCDIRSVVVCQENE